MKMLKMAFFTIGVTMIKQGYAETVWQGSAILVIKPAKMSEFKRAVAKIIEPTRKEAGSITYYGYQVVDEMGNETNRFEFHEIWRSKEAMLIDHKEKSPHMRVFFDEIKANTSDSYLESFEVRGQHIKIVN
ncbi:MAG: antibiotic biosynthesis monooxygenase [Bacteriovoracaceae bacterium]|nr:antibiotic biosynthesis monooxygenase [Bacteriovoracaceae bacterium]